MTGPVDVQWWELYAGAAALVVIGFLVGAAVGAGAMLHHLTGGGFANRVERDLGRATKRAGL